MSEIKAALNEGLAACEELFDRDYFGNHNVQSSELTAIKDRFAKAALAYEALQKEIDITNKLLLEQTEVLREIPECELHGLCLPHIKQWIANAKAKLDSLTVK